MTDDEVLQGILKQLQLALQDLRAHDLSWSVLALRGALMNLGAAVEKLEVYLGADQGLPGSQL